MFFDGKYEMNYFIGAQHVARCLKFKKTKRKKIQDIFQRSWALTNHGKYFFEKSNVQNEFNNKYAILTLKILKKNPCPLR